MPIVISPTDGISIPAGIYVANTFNGSYSGGVVLDYINGSGRLSVGSNDSIIIYGGGVANTQLLSISSNGYSTFVGGGAFNGSGALRVPSGNTAQRPANPNVGNIRINTDYGSVESYTANGWVRPLNLNSNGNISLSGIATVDGVNSVGFLTIPQNAQANSYTLVTTDSGKHIYHAANTANATYTIPANTSVPFPIGTAVTFVNMSSNVVTISISTDDLYLAGTGTTGNRLLARYGEATALKITGNSWIISGAGIT